MLSDTQIREVFHFCFLQRLLQLSDPNRYILKSGMNLRFFFNSPRYSEDMDIDVLAGHVPTLKKNAYKILQDAAFKRSLRLFDIEDLAILFSGGHTLSTAQAPLISKVQLSRALDCLMGKEQGYVSFLIALHLHGLVSQIPKTIQIATTGHARTLGSPIGRYEFLQIINRNSCTPKIQDTSRWLWLPMVPYSRSISSITISPLTSPKRSLL